MERDEAKGFVEVMNAYDENFNLTDDQENLLIQLKGKKKPKNITIDSEDF